MPFKAVSHLYNISHPTSLPFSFKSLASRSVDMTSEIHVCLHTQSHKPFKMSQFCAGDCHCHWGRVSDVSLRITKLKMSKFPKFILLFKVFLAEDQRKEKEKPKMWLLKTTMLCTKAGELRSLFVVEITLTTAAASIETRPGSSVIFRNERGGQMFQVLEMDLESQLFPVFGNWPLKKAQ